MPHHRVHRGVRALRQLALHLRVVGGQTGQRRQVAAGRTSGDRHEIAVAAELVDIGARPSDRGLDVGDVRGPRVMRRHPVVDGQAHPAHLGQMRHQRVALEQTAAVHPGATWHEEQHRCGFGGQILAAPHVEQLGRAGAVADRCPVNVATLLAQFPQRRRALGCRPLDLEVLGGDDAAQRRLGDRIRAVTFLAL